MKVKKLKFTSEIKIKLTITLILLSLLVLSFFFADKIEAALFSGSKLGSDQTDRQTLTGSPLLVDYIDVGQGSATLISLPSGEFALIDGGNTENASALESFLRGRGVSQIDYLISTHADSDHIGSFAYILSKFEVKKIYRPFQIAGYGTNQDEFEPSKDEDLSNVYFMLSEKYGVKNKISRVTTKIYNDFISAAYNETYFSLGVETKSEVTVFYDGLKIEGAGYEFEFFAPLVIEDKVNLYDYSSTYGYATVGYGSTNSNDNSAILTLFSENETFFFSGDAAWSDSDQTPEQSGSFGELDFVESLTVDERLKLKNISVYLAGHHGSKFSSGASLLEVICPKYCVISVGEDNSYGHPHSEMLSRLQSASPECTVLLTSEQGTISFGVLQGKLCYASDAVVTEDEPTVSFQLISSVVFIFIVITIFAIKPPTKKQSS